MNAPDKIYVAESLIKKLYGNKWSPTPYITRENTEYIRKDALLEKLSRAKELRLESGAKESSDGIRVIDALIEMVNRNVV